jgi:peptidoglycan/LPS O-acetylase OafA/YrhL
MNLQLNSDTRRLPFLDNLRALMVVLVLIFHAGASYSSAVDFWPFHDANSNGLIDIFLFLGDVFMMSVLFFVAGYFALPSISKRGSRRFVAGKFKVLGIPWLVATVGILPILDYIHFTTQNSATVNFGKYWLLSMKKILEFHFGWLDMTSYRPMTEHFYQRYVWFLSLLLLFFIIFTAMYAVSKRTNFTKQTDATPAKSNWVASW